MPRTNRDKAADFGDILAALGQSATGEAPACPARWTEPGTEIEPGSLDRGSSAHSPRVRQENPPDRFELVRRTNAARRMSIANLLIDEQMRQSRSPR